MESKSKVCQKTDVSKGICECDKCVRRQVRRWLVNGRPSIFPMCQQFRKAYFEDDHSTLESLQFIFGDGRCLCCGYTLLHLAVSVGSKELVSQCLNRNYNAEVKTDNGETALHLACVSRDPWIVQQLLVYKAKVDAIDELGCTSLQICLAHDKPSKAILKMLLDNGAKPSKLFNYDEDSICQIIKVNSRNSSGVMPLYEAVHKNDHVLTRSLLEDGACPDSLKGYSRTLLQAACLNGSVLCAKALLEAGVNVNEKDPESRTALHCAVISNSKDLIVLLSDYKCDFRLRDSDNYTALEMAVLTNRFEVTVELLKRGVTCKDLMLLEALERQCTDTVLALLKHCQFRLQDPKFAKKMLYCAIGTEQHQVVDRLLDLGVKVPYEGPEDEADKVAVVDRKFETKKQEVMGGLVKKNVVFAAEVVKKSTREIRPRMTRKLSDAPCLYPRPPRFPQYSQIGCSKGADKAVKSKPQIRQQDRFISRHDEVRTSKKCMIMSKHTANISDKGATTTRPKTSKTSSPIKDSAIIFEVKSFKASAQKSGQPCHTSNNVDSFFKTYSHKESKAKLTTCEGVFSKKRTSKGVTTSVDTFFKFYEFCVM